MSRESETMGCRRAFDVDLVACLLDRDRPEWEAFRDHYPTCAECATEVRTWTELQTELAPAHPEPARLLRYEDDPAALRSQERHAIREHVAACAACRDELHMLRTTDVAALVRAGTSAVAPAASPAPVRRRRPRAARRGFGTRLRGLLWHPGFAYALAVALMIPALAPYRDVLVPAPRSADEAGRAREVEARKVDAAAPARVADHDRPGQALDDAPAEAPSAAMEAFRAAPSAPKAGSARPDAPPQAVWPRLDMTPTSSHLVIAASPGLILTLPVPGDAATAGPAELRVRDAAGHRELREEHFGPPTSRVAMRVPGEWLVPGRYVVELYTGGDRPVATATLNVAARTGR